jgi:hypothetical protein
MLTILRISSGLLREYHNILQPFFGVKKKGSVETHMNRSSHPDNENHIYDVLPPQGLSEARRGKMVSCIFLYVIDPPRGRPFGVGGFITIGGMRVSNPIFVFPNTMIFVRNPAFSIIRLFINSYNEGDPPSLLEGCNRA